MQGNLIFLLDFVKENQPMLKSTQMLQSQGASLILQLLLSISQT
jgi:hypothetical protein